MCQKSPRARRFVGASVHRFAVCLAKTWRTDSHRPTEKWFITWFSKQWQPKKLRYWTASLTANLTFRSILFLTSPYYDFSRKTIRIWLFRFLLQVSDERTLLACRCRHRALQAYSWQWWFDNIYAWVSHNNVNTTLTSFLNEIYGKNFKWISGWIERPTVYCVVVILWRQGKFFVCANNEFFLVFMHSLKLRQSWPFLIQVNQTKEIADDRDHSDISHKSNYNEPRWTADLYLLRSLIIKKNFTFDSMLWFTFKFHFETKKSWSPRYRIQFLCLFYSISRPFKIHTDTFSQFFRFNYCFCVCAGLPLILIQCFVLFSLLFPCATWYYAVSFNVYTCGVHVRVETFVWTSLPISLCWAPSFWWNELPMPSYSLTMMRKRPNTNIRKFINPYGVESPQQQ